MSLPVWTWTYPVGSSWYTATHWYDILNSNLAKSHQLYCFRSIWAALPPHMGKLESGNSIISCTLSTAFLFSVNQFQTQSFTVKHHCKHQMTANTDTHTIRYRWPVITFISGQNHTEKSVSHNGKSVFYMWKHASVVLVKTERAGGRVE